MPDIHPRPFLAGLACLWGAVGCGTPVIDTPFDGGNASDGAVVSEHGAGGADARLDHGYALLLDLLADEKQVDGILLLKSPRQGVADLLREIAATATRDRRLVESVLLTAPPVETSADGLPAIEVDARRRIRNEETPALLLAGGRAFETRILLTQQKAVQYLQALCRSLATADPNRVRAGHLSDMADRWAALEQGVRRWLTVVETPPGPAPGKD